MIQRFVKLIQIQLASVESFDEWRVDDEDIQNDFDEQMIRVVIQFETNLTDQHSIR